MKASFERVFRELAKVQHEESVRSVTITADTTSERWPLFTFVVEQERLGFVQVESNGIDFVSFVFTDSGLQKWGP